MSSIASPFSPDRGPRKSAKLVSVAGRIQLKKEACSMTKPRNAARRRDLSSISTYSELRTSRQRASATAMGRVHLRDAYLAVGESKSEAGTGRTVPLNTLALEVLKTYSVWLSRQVPRSQPTMVRFSGGQAAADRPDEAMH